MEANFQKFCAKRFKGGLTLKVQSKNQKVTLHFLKIFWHKNSKSHFQHLVEKLVAPSVKTYCSHFWNIRCLRLQLDPCSGGKKLNYHILN